MSVRSAGFAVLVMISVSASGNVTAQTPEQQWMPDPRVLRCAKSLPSKSAPAIRNSCVAEGMTIRGQFEPDCLQFLAAAQSYADELDRAAKKASAPRELERMSDVQQKYFEQCRTHLTHPFPPMPPALLPKSSLAPGSDI